MTKAILIGLLSAALLPAAARAADRDHRYDGGSRSYSRHEQFQRRHDHGETSRDSDYRWAPREDRYVRRDADHTVHYPSYHHVEYHSDHRHVHHHVRRHVRHDHD